MADGFEVVSSGTKIVPSNLRTSIERIPSKPTTLSEIHAHHPFLFTHRWIDTFIPGLSKAGGFTITSTPAEARPNSHAPPYIELAVQKSKNPPAQWLWRPQEEILGAQLAVRVGG
ncbi:hypothetical protein CERZMDRAFT_112002 [Cercospora zeae-maydis SCOH1-5]|uniref:Uncharacterized protein n=1 Tax=Cercospora zeae-maydis SCOH1-5 TaxID=717836 RepID=A0A6A6FFV3_9PEZI|nr:hypothetical protein CERZMDRAFT_112002 [Cercospora zeae-maydis SCOH1-5]